MPTGIYIRTKEHIKNFIKSRKGYRHSIETKRKISFANKGNKRTLGSFKKGHLVPKEWREKIRLANKGKVLSIKTKEKMRLSHLGEKAWNWRNGKRKHSSGYILILRHEHPFCDSHGYVYEHRLVIEKHLGRYLKSSEEIHHLGAKDDNRSQMLMAFVTKGIHKRFEMNLFVKPEEIIFDGRKI